jgi:hypothetical protein
MHNRYLGVLAALQSLGIIQPGVTPVGGVSGGGIAAAASCLGLYMPEQLARNHENAAACRAQALYCAGTLDKQVRKGLQKLADGMAEEEVQRKISACNASTYIYYAQGRPILGSVPARVDSSTLQVSDVSSNSRSVDQCM